MGKANQKNCSLESVVNDANLKNENNKIEKYFDVKNVTTGKGRVIQNFVYAFKKSNGKTEVLSWVFTNNGNNMLSFAKRMRNNGENYILLETVSFSKKGIEFFELKEDGMKHYRIDFADGKMSIKDKDGKELLEDEYIEENIKKKILGYRDEMCSKDEIIKLLEKNGYVKREKKEKEDTNFAIDSKLIALARESKSFDEYMKKANAKGYYDMMEIGQNWELRKNSEFSVSKKKPILTFWF